MTVDYDAIVVGAGPAGSACALALARRGRRVALLERGAYPGAKNMYGGVIYPRVLDAVLPQWWESAPIERFVVRRTTMVLSGDRALSVDFRDARWGRPPYNGVTALRANFDRWLADQAVAAGAELFTATTATGLRRDGPRVVGVTTDRPDGDFSAPVTIACDGANSFLAREAGLYPRFGAEHFTLGVKEVLALPAAEIESRCGLGEREGLDIEMVGATGDVAGGGFFYTNASSVAIGVVLHLNELAAAKRRPEEILADLKRHPAIAPLVQGGELVEYSAHLIPEGGVRAMPALGAPGLLVCGDAASLTLAAGLWLEGVNFALASGLAAGEAVADDPARCVGGYEARLRDGFVLADHRRLKDAPAFILSNFVQRDQGPLLCDVVGEAFTVTNPVPKPGLWRIARRARRSRGLRWRDLVRASWRAWRIYG